MEKSEKLVVAGERSDSLERDILRRASQCELKGMDLRGQTLTEDQRFTRRPISGKKKQHKHKLFGPDFLRTFLTLTPECPGVKKFLPTTGTAGKRTFWRGRPRFSARTSMSRRVVEKLCTKKVCVDFLAPTIGAFFCPELRAFTGFEARFLRPFPTSLVTVKYRRVSNAALANAALVLSSKNWKKSPRRGAVSKNKSKKPWASIFTLSPCGKFAGNRCRFSESGFPFRRCTHHRK